MFRNMVTSLFKYDRIRTTDVKAKELKRWADKMVTLAKQGGLDARRRALALMREKDVVHKLFAEAPERFGSISGGYTRIVKDGRRPGDAAPVSIVELVAPEKSKKKEATKKKAKAPSRKKTAAKKPVKAKKEKKAEPVPDAKGTDAGLEKETES
jgi:large subunit ribosomal protein L17